MAKKPRITLDIPHPEDFEDEGLPPAYIPAHGAVVDAGIDLLQCFVTQWT